MKLSELKTNPTNPRTIKDDKFKKLVQSLKDFPEMMEKRPLVCVTDASDGKLYPLGGNMRLKALQELKYKDIPDSWVMIADDWTEEQRKEFVIKDNVSFGEWDWALLKNDWIPEELEYWGVDLPDSWCVDEIDAEDDGFEASNNITTDILSGDLFKIGKHRLLCGDSTSKDDVLKLMNNEKADLIFTDPPYEIEDAIIYSLFSEISLNTNILIFASDKQIPFIFKANIGDFKRLYTLDTGIASPTNNDVYVNHIALLRFKIGEATKFNNIHDGGRSIIKTDYRKNLKDQNFGHKHQKSLKTLGLFIKYWSNKEQLIVDLYGGSGSTMAASEQLNRQCFMMEKDPINCQIIINRMKEIYNMDAIKI
jgi:16S rRNA G966 N2-methylase RsmD